MSEPFTLTGHNPADGQLPEGWQVSPLGELATLSLGKMLDKKQFTGLNPVPYLRNINVRWDEFDLSDMQVMDITPEQFERVSLQAGDIVVCEGGEPGRSSVWSGSEPIAIQKALHRVRPHENLNPRFLYFLFEMEFRGSGDHPLFTGTTIKHLPKEKIATVQIPVPPSAEQERIVEILEEQLSRLDAALESVRVVREKAAQFRRSLLHAAFTGTLTGHNPADGQLPEGWESVPIGTLSPNGDFFDGDWVESKDQDPTGAVRLTQLADIGEGNFRNRSDRWLRDDQAEHLNVNFLQEGDLLIARMPDPLGRCCALPKLEHYSVTVVDVAVLRIRSQSILNTFVMWILNSPIVRRRMVELASGTTRQRISRKNLSTIELPIPPLAEQERIVEILEEQLSRLDAALAVADAIEKRSAALRRSLLHAAFTGRLTEQWRESVHV